MPNQPDLLDLLHEPEPKGTLDALLAPDQIYEFDDPALFVRLPEDNRFERKGYRTAPKDLAPLFSAFSNGPSTKGGVIVLGIHDKTLEFEGCHGLSDDQVTAFECAAMVYCPSARVTSRKVPIVRAGGETDFLIAFRVPYVPNQLVTLTDGRAYERLGDQTKQLDDIRKQQIRVDKGERPFEVEAIDLRYPDLFDVLAIKAFCSRVRASRGISEPHEDAGILASLRLGLQVDGEFIPNNACALLFAKDPRYLFPGAIVHFLRYKGADEQSGRDLNLEKDRQIDGNLSNIIKEAASIIDANLREFTEWSGETFSTTVEYPKDAWYELLVNACVHRSYMFRSIPIFVKMFDDRIVFQSPGGFMPGVTPENIYERHHPRNRIIMDALRETGEVRCINEGTKRVRVEMARAGLPPPLFKEQSGEGSSVSATLFNNASVRATILSERAMALIGGNIADILTPEEARIINHVAQTGRTTVTATMQLLGEVRWHTTSLKLDRLRRKGVLRYVSSKARDRNAYYEIAPGLGGDKDDTG